VKIDSYAVVNKTLSWALAIEGAPAPVPASTTLPINLPGGYTARPSYHAIAHAWDSGLYAAYVDASQGTYILIRKNTAATWDTAVIWIYCTITVPLV
jgi:hypothetical protein